MVKEIHLHSFKRPGLIALVDDADFDRVIAQKWHPSGKGKKTEGRTQIDGVNVSMSHFILGLPGNEWIDHQNLNRLDCQRRNLRPCTPAQNGFNREAPKNSKTGFKGVCFDTRHLRYKGHIQANGKRKSLGYFKSAVAAARAYDDAARELHGEFARLNFPNELPTVQQRLDLAA